MTQYYKDSNMLYIIWINTGRTRNIANIIYLIYPAPVSWK